MQFYRLYSASLTDHKFEFEFGQELATLLLDHGSGLRESTNLDEMPIMLLRSDLRLAFLSQAPSLIGQFVQLIDRTILHTVEELKFSAQSDL
jgi:hypothetical protein